MDRNNLGQFVKGESPERRFWDHVDRCGAGGCWLWTAAHDHDGYGWFTPRHGERMQLAHRFAYKLRHGSIPRGLFVCHHCDTPGCVNPDHLFLGTAKDNSRDMCSKQRQANGDKHGARLHPESVLRGEKNRGGGKLTAEQVKSIRNSYAAKEARQVTLAGRYGVTQCMISAIVRGAAWTHLLEVAA